MNDEAYLEGAYFEVDPLLACPPWEEEALAHAYIEALVEHRAAISAHEGPGRVYCANNSSNQPCRHCKEGTGDEWAMFHAKMKLKELSDD